MKIIFALFLLMFLILPGRVKAQNAESETNRETSKSFVSVPVTVSDRENHYILDLKKEDFTIYQDGVKQKTIFFSAYNEPLKIVLLLDTSKSTRNVIGKIKDAAKEFVDSLKKNDQCQVATFDSQVNVINSFTSDHQAIKNSLDRIKINNYGATLLYNAVNQIVQNSFKDTKGRKVIIVLTDGNDFGSSLTKDEFLNRLEESDILIYSIFFKSDKDFNVSADTPKKPKKKKKKSRESRINAANVAQTVYVPTDEQIANLEKKEFDEAVDTLKKMSDITAGRFYLSDVPKLKKVFKTITGELTQQYRLGYDAKNAASDLPTHEISVKVDRPDVVVRTRGIFRTKKF
ncbi:MAG: VWA domain-containing protein [Acidobacteriota bacterium]